MGSDCISSWSLLIFLLYIVVSLHVEEWGYLTRIQECIYNPPIQAERKCSSLWQTQGHLSVVDCWEDTGKNPTESPERASWSGWTSTRKLVWIQEGQRNNRHGLYSKATPRKMSRTKCGPLHELCQPHQSIRHSQSWWTFVIYDKVWLSSQVQCNGAAISRWHACTGSEWWSILRTISGGDKWCQARLCTGTDTVQHDVLCHAYRCFFKTVMLASQSDTILMASCLT